MKIVSMLRMLTCGLAVVTLAACQDGQTDVSEEVYCTMVERWHADAEAGIPSNSRTGWPPYQGECK